MSSVPTLGLRANAGQFALLVLVNAFVGAMVGLERAVLPLLAEEEFRLASHTAALSFLVSFGLTKAFANLAAGWLSDRLGRKGVLVSGWLVGLPVPLLIILAPTWSWVVAANLLLGVQQGLCWSTTVIMKVDLVGPRRRGLAMGLNESAGYLAVSLAALGSGYLAAAYGLRPAPFYPGLVIGLAGLILSATLVRETRPHAAAEALQSLAGGPPAAAGRGARRSVLAVTQAGVVNNLNDAVAWGLLPLLLVQGGLALGEISLVAAAVPGAWGLAQAGTGALSDWLGRKGPIVSGMVVQAAGLLLLSQAQDLHGWLAGAGLLGLGTALAYPTFLAAISDLTPPAQRGSALGAFRLWRDLGYAAGGLGAGLLADALGLRTAVAATGLLTLLSGALAGLLLGETRPQ